MKPMFMKKAKRAKQVAAAQAVIKGMEQLSTYTIIKTINSMIGILRSRGVTITDWDDRTKDIYGMKYLGNTAFILAPQSRDAGPDNADKSEADDERIPSADEGTETPEH